jgi:adenine-specific DNA methylase
MIFREIDRVLPRRLWAGRTFLDGFLGGGSVALYAKAMGFNVVACDIAERALVTGRALIANSRIKLTREDVIRILTPNPEPPLRIEREMCPAIFTRNVARFIDRALALATVTPDSAKSALLKMLAVRIALLEHPMSQVRKGTIHRLTTGEYEAITESCVHHYVDGLRLTRVGRVWPIAEQINAGVFQGEGQVLQGSVLDLLPTIDADVAYFDPPYPGVMSYEKEYKVIDEILEGTTRPTSPFTAKDGAAMIDGLFERARHIPIWLLSLGNAVVTLDELAEKMRRLGRDTKAIEIKYQHLPAVATETKKEENREFLIVGWDSAAPFFAALHYPMGSGVEEVGRRGPDDNRSGAHLDSPRSEAPTSPGLLDNPLEHRALDLFDDPHPSGDVYQVGEDHPGVDDPLPTLVERPVNEHEIVGGSIPNSHRVKVPSTYTDVND